MWLEEAQRPPPRPWGPPRPSAALPAGGCPARHPAYDAPAPQQRPCSLEEFAVRSTLHGIQHIFRHQRYTARNLLWLLAFLGSLALLIHAYAKCMGLYFQYPHNTQLEEEMACSKTFPAVTLCNLNPARFSQLSGHDLYWAGEMLGLLDGAGRPLVLESTERSRLEALLGMLAVSEEKSRRFDLEEFYGRVGHQLDLGEMLVHCMFSGEECNGSDFQTLNDEAHKLYGSVRARAALMAFAIWRRRLRGGPAARPPACLPAARTCAPSQHLPSTSSGAGLPAPAGDTMPPALHARPAVFEPDVILPWSR
ncbi:acid-sensing ion channel 1-like [Theristicus caerulescens]